MLKGNGQLLVKAHSGGGAFLLAAKPVAITGMNLTPLWEAPPAGHALMALAPVTAPNWFVAAPADAVAAAPDENPWDSAHKAAQQNNYAHYVEPDIIHDRATTQPMQRSALAPEDVAGKGLDGDWPPKNNDAKGLSPAWHLLKSFTGFAEVRGQATGNGIRVAHLDTGFRKHDSTPRHMREDLGYDYWGETDGAYDPGDKFPLTNPGHGTATLALLAGDTMHLSYAGQNYDGDFGGAPDIEVIPVRISPSVIHVYTSTMAKGLYHAMSPPKDPLHPCDVVTISHGGLPTAAWADAVNACYAAGIVIVAASGDSYYLKLVDLMTRFTVYPSAFNRVITALGTTWAKAPYKTDKFDVMQGCWGPDSVMEKAIAAYTPNVAWMTFDKPDGFDMDGAGTSSSTPQIAAACALWLELYSAKLPRDWRRVEACRMALFRSAANRAADKRELGRGILDVVALLDAKLAAQVIEEANGGAYKESAEDSVSFPFWRLLVGEGPPNSEAERMYETEVAQVILASDSAMLRDAAAKAYEPNATLSDGDQQTLSDALKGEQISNALRQRLG